MNNIILGAVLATIFWIVTIYALCKYGQIILNQRKKDICDNLDNIPSYKPGDIIKAKYKRENQQKDLKVMYYPQQRYDI